MKRSLLSQCISKILTHVVKQITGHVLLFFLPKALSATSLSPTWCEEASTVFLSGIYGSRQGFSTSHMKTKAVMYDCLFNINPICSACSRRYSRSFSSCWRRTLFGMRRIMKIHKLLRDRAVRTSCGVEKVGLFLEVRDPRCRRLPVSGLFVDEIQNSNFGFIHSTIFKTGVVW